MIEVTFRCDYKVDNVVCPTEATERIWCETSSGVRKDIEVCNDHKMEMAWILVNNSNEANPLKLWSERIKK